MFKSVAIATCMLAGAQAAMLEKKSKYHATVQQSHDHSHYPTHGKQHYQKHDTYVAQKTTHENREFTNHRRQSGDKQNKRSRSYSME